VCRMFGRTFLSRLLCTLKAKKNQNRISEKPRLLQPWSGCVKRVTE